MYPPVYPPATQRVGQQTAVTAGTTVTVTIPAPSPVGPENLTTINWIKFSAQSTTSPSTWTLSVNGTIIARKTLAAGVSIPDVVFDFNFGASYPIWAASSSDTLVVQGFDVVVIGTATVSAACLTVGYTYMAASAVRP